MPQDEGMNLTTPCGVAGYAGGPGANGPFAMYVTIIRAAGDKGPAMALLCCAPSRGLQRTLGGP